MNCNNFKIKKTKYGFRVTDKNGKIIIDAEHIEKDSWFKVMKTNVRFSKTFMDENSNEYYGFEAR